MPAHEGIAIRQVVVSLRQEGKSIRDIAAIVKRGVKFVRGVTMLAFCSFFVKFSSTGVVDKLGANCDPLKRAPGSGRPRKTNKREDRVIVKEIRKKPFSSLPKLIKDGKIINLSKWTISRRLKEVYVSKISIFCPCVLHFTGWGEILQGRKETKDN